MRHKLYERLGKFVIQKEHLDALPDWLQVLMARVIILRADFSFQEDGVEYTALSPEFDIGGINCSLRLYRPVVEDGRFLRWSR